MEQYVRDFETDTIETFTLENAKELKDIFKVINHIDNFKLCHTNIIH